MSSDLRVERNEGFKMKNSVDGLISQEVSSLKIL